MVNPQNYPMLRPKDNPENRGEYLFVRLAGYQGLTATPKDFDRCINKWLKILFKGYKAVFGTVTSDLNNHTINIPKR